MPNWCNNSVKIKFKSVELAQSIYEELQDEHDKSAGGRSDAHTFFWYFRPRPKYVDDQPVDVDREQSHPDNWYWWNINNWGCKWEPNIDWISINEDTVIITFDTAWAPPIALYEFMREEYKNIISIYADWFEPGCLMLGEYDNGTINDYEPSKDNLPNIPKHLVEAFSLEEWYADDDE